MFVYCNNNPINLSDPDGYFAINAVCAAIGGIAGWYFGDYVARSFGLSGGQYWAVRAGVTVGGAVIGWFAGAALAAIINGFLYQNPNIAMQLSSTMLKGLGFAKYVATRALSSVGNFYVKSKHLMGATGDWSKFATTSQYQIQSWISQALSKGTNFQVNSSDSYYIIYNLGKVIGTNGETKIKVVFTFTGKIITSFPIK